MVFHGSRLVFMVPGQFFKVPGRFSWFFMVPGWFSWFFSKMYPPKLYPGPTIHSRSAARRAAQDLVMMMMMMLAVMIMTSSKERQQMSTAWFQTSQTTKAEQGWTWAWYDEEDEVGDGEDCWHHDDGHFNGVSANHYPSSRSRISPLKRRMAKLGQY